MANPHADTQLAKYISKRIDELRDVKTQSEIAAQAGFTNANFLSMLKPVYLDACHCLHE